PFARLESAEQSPEESAVHFLYAPFQTQKLTPQLRRSPTASDRLAVVLQCLDDYVGYHLEPTHASRECCALSVTYFPVVWLCRFTSVLENQLDVLDAWRRDVPTNQQSKDILGNLVKDE